MATEQAVEVGTNLVTLTLTQSVALSASCLEEVGTLLCVTCNIISYNLILSQAAENCRRKATKLYDAPRLQIWCKKLKKCDSWANAITTCLEMPSC